MSQITSIGPYAPAILRFLILYPHDYPSLPPTIIFITDVFHPLITPLTTYTYTTSSDSSDTVSASDDERLPPGGFNLRHGFSTWLGRAHKNGGPSTLPSIHASRDFSQNPPLEVSSDIKVLDDDVVAKPSENSSFQSISVPPTDMKPSDRKITIIEILEYVKRAFYDDQFLDGVPLEAAGNPGAWKAWRAYRASKGVKLDGFGKTAGVIDDREDWNWDGVWEQRVRKGVESSIADSTLYAGTSGGDDVVGISSRKLEIQLMILLDTIRQHRPTSTRRYQSEDPWTLEVSVFHCLSTASDVVGIVLRADFCFDCRLSESAFHI